MQPSYAERSIPVGELDVAVRSEFIAKTYGHLMAAIALFVAIEMFFFANGLAEGMAEFMLGTNWLLVLGAFVLVSYGASTLARRATDRRLEYAGLVALVVAEAVIFVPLLWLANEFAPGTISSAAVVTALGFGALTILVFTTRKDFSFLGPFLAWIGIGALLLIVAAVIFGFELGTIFSVAMIVFAGASILYETSKIMRVYPEDRYVAASMELFASVALLFWYVLRLFLSRR